MTDKVVLIGAGGHCKVILDMIKNPFDIVGITDTDCQKHGAIFYGVPVIGDDSILDSMYQEGTKSALVTLGSVGDSSVRRKLYELATKIGFRMINVTSEHSIISPSLKIGRGNVVMDGVIIHADAIIGNNCIINTGAIIEHDCVIGDHAHISPGVRLAGGVKIGSGTHVGMGASIIQDIVIGENCIIGAGSVVVCDVPTGSIVAGVPAADIKRPGRN